MEDGVGDVPAGGSNARRGRVHRILRVFTGVVVAIVLIGTLLGAYGLYRWRQNLRPEAAPDVDRVQQLPAVAQGRTGATRDIDAAFAALEERLGSGFARRTQSVLDECGSTHSNAGVVFSPSRYGPVTCRREVVRYYVAEGPRSTRAGEVATALYEAGMYGTSAPSVAAAERQCATPRPPDTAKPESADPQAPPAPQPSETPCGFVTSETGAVPSRGIQAEVRTYDPQAPQAPLHQARPLDVLARARTVEPANLGLVTETTAASPTGTCILAVSVLITYYVEAD